MFCRILIWFVECAFEFEVWQVRECVQRLRKVKAVVLISYQLPANQFGGWELTRLNNVHFSSILV